VYTKSFEAVATFSFGSRGLIAGTVGRKSAGCNEWRPVRRELAAAAQAAPPDAEWCWGVQASDALVAMQRLADEAGAAGADAIDPDKLAAQVELYRSAVLIGVSDTAPRSDTIMSKHNALARRRGAHAGRQGLRRRRDRRAHCDQRPRPARRQPRLQRTADWPTGARRTRKR
jgi:hypothetical protein